ncbi:hypothetical protein ACFQZO_27270 [Bradyrhizobium sp. GCM10027634]|uniref:hypothetical protein n=1 Tax=unclassified Bradyrhizobium TaxID=2631580 RepID=UPI00188A45E5|nr:MULTISPECIES: hypothetical protein [unclassified Bradyrhizobium]MDN5004552.1 hypothetical protein [Bradyrhizobium sp. WYCCWR 12677]QOZ43869.1 hypothetical protein XH89_10500 [Bradyrhizobium sp. CCBAU 53340]
MSDRSVNSSGGRRTALAAFAGLALVVASISPSTAAAPTPANAVSAAGTAAGPGSSNATDFSAARRHYRHYRRGPNAAGLAFMGLAAGLIGGAIAESRRQEYYDNYYYGGPRYYGPGYGYYGGPRYYYNPY